jgi:transposase
MSWSFLEKVVPYVATFLLLLRKRKLDGIRRLGIDEVAARSGHRYLTLATGLDERLVIWGGQRRSSGTLEDFRWLEGAAEDSGTS